MLRLESLPVARSLLAIHLLIIVPTFLQNFITTNNERQLQLQAFVKADNVPINLKTVEDWLVVDLNGTRTYKPMFSNNYSVVPHDDVSSWPVNTYYWQAPKPYYQWKLYTYGGDLTFLVNHIVTRGDTSGKYLDEPDLVLEGGSKDLHLKIGYRLPKEMDMVEGFDKNQTIKMPLREQGWRYLVEQEDDNGAKHLKLSDDPVGREDFLLVLAGLDRALIRAKYHMDQVEGDLYDVNMHIIGNRSDIAPCNDACVGPLIVDIDAINVLFRQIAELYPLLKDGPWLRLAYLNESANKLEGRLNEFFRILALGDKLLGKIDPNLEWDILLAKVRFLEDLSPKTAGEANRVRIQAQILLDDILNRLWNMLRTIIKKLNEHGFGPSGMSPDQIEQIVQKSEMILIELRGRNLKPSLEDAERAKRLANVLLAKIQQLLIDPKKSDDLLKRLNHLLELIEDFTRIIDNQVLKPIKEADELISKGHQRYKEILELIKQAEDRGKESRKILDDAQMMINVTRECLSKESNYLTLLPLQLAELNNSIHEIEVKRSILTSVNPDYQMKYVEKCRDHSNALWDEAQKLEQQFKETRDISDFANQAINAYIKIVKAINEAEDAARNASFVADKAYKEIAPDFDDSLAERARKSKETSQKLLKEAQELHNLAHQRLSLDLEKSKTLIEQLIERMKILRRELDKINSALDQLANKDLRRQLQEMDIILKNLLERVSEVHRQLQTLADIIYQNLKPQLERISVGSAASFGNISQVIEAARLDLRASINYANSSKNFLKEILKLEERLDLDLDLLRRKIQLAHQEAASVHISLMPSSDSGICTRSYFVPAILSAHEGGISIGGFNVKQISLTWSLHSEEAGSFLLYIGSKTNDEFLAIEMYERHIRLVCSLNSYSPSGIQVITHPRVIDLNDNGLLSDETWYLITVLVINEDQLRLSVKPFSKVLEKDSQQITHRLTASSGGSSRLTISPYGEADINFYVGGLPSEQSAPSQIKSNKLTGCLYNLAVNDQQIGLWNFKTNQGCEGCTEGPSETSETAIFSFTGMQSYATVSQSRHYDRTKYMVSMSIKTTDSDALLFVSLSTTTNNYLSVFLSKGRIVCLIGKLSSTHVNYLGLSSSSLYEIAMSAHSQLLSDYSTKSKQQQQPQPQPLEHSIITSKEYNNGQWFKITAEKDQTKLVLAVEDEYRESIVDDKLLTLDMDQVFFGGVWPMIRPKKFVNTSLEFNSYSGCMKDIQIETMPIDLLKRQYYGVETGCSRTQSGRFRSLSKISTRIQYPLPAGRR